MGAIYGGAISTPESGGVKRFRPAFSRRRIRFQVHAEVMLSDRRALECSRIEFASRTACGEAVEAPVTIHEWMTKWQIGNVLRPGHVWPGLLKRVARHLMRIFKGVIWSRVPTVKIIGHSP